MFSTVSTGINDLGLARLKGLRRTAIRLIMAYLPLGLLFFVARVYKTGMLLLMEILALTLLTLWHLRSIECPKCGQLFFVGGWRGYLGLQRSMRLPLGRECAHCDFTIDG